MISSFNNSFGNTGRLDAEYYLPKYEEIENKIKSYFNGYEELGNILCYISTGEYAEEYLSKEEHLKFYIRGTNMTWGQVDIDNDYFVNPSNFTKFVETNDIITSRVGNIGSFAEITSEVSGAVYSDNIICFRLPSNYYASVYTLLFNSKFMHELIDRLARGSVQQRLNQETLKELIVPKLTKECQEMMKCYIDQVKILRKQSLFLLEIAKKSVEIAIEQNEDSALKYLEEKSNEILNLNKEVI